MCKNCIVVVSTPKMSQKDTRDYIQMSKREILSSCKTLPNGEEFKVEINFVDKNGHIDYRSKKGSHIKRVVFDLEGHREEEKIIGNIKKGLSKVNKVENPLLMRVSTATGDLHGCKNVSKMKHATCHFG